MSSSEKKRSKRRTANLFKHAIQKTLKPPENLTVSQWAEKYRVLDESSNFKGRWSNSITPYLVGIMDTFNDPYIQRINFVKSTQIGGTEAMFNMIGYIVTQSPAPTLIVYPTDDLAKDTSKDRMQPSLLKTKSFAEKFRKNESKELKLRFYGMNIYLTGAKTATKLSSKSLKYLFFDEIDKLDGATKKEASPYNLAVERTRTYTLGRKIFTTSTPTLKSNYVWNLHETAEEQRNYFVPCPYCGKYIVFAFKQIRFPSEEGMSARDRAEKAIYICQECQAEISNKDKNSMIQFGEWRTVKKDNLGKSKSVSFWINSLYSRFLTWEEIALEFLNSKEDPEKLQNFVNSWLAEPWEDTKLKVNEELVMECQTEYQELEVPDWAKMLTGGIDVQENCIYWTIRAWGNHMTSQNIAHGQALSLQEAEHIMCLTYRKRDGSGLLVSLALIDSGDQTDMVYDFCTRNAEWALPCKGSATMLNHYKISKINKVGSSAFGQSLVLIDVGKYKDLIAGRMMRKKGEGAWMVYHGCDLDYANQVTAEHKITTRVKGRPVQMWVQKKSHADNHYLDTEVYAVAAADIMGVRQLYLQDEIVEVMDENEEQQSQNESTWLSQGENWL